MVMHAIVAGLGSIGKRHARILRELGMALTTVSRRPGLADFIRIEDAVSAHPDALLVIANETGAHVASLQRARLNGHRGVIVVEKPLASNPDELLGIERTDSVWVAYNLRFAPIVMALREALTRADHPISVRMHVGQHLSTWRPGTEIPESYSAHAAHGGGALRDLSHELDLLGLLWGRPIGLCALGGRRAAVTVDSDDCWSLLLRTNRGVDVALSLNYLDRPPTRFIHVNTADETFQVDLINSVITCNGVRVEVLNDRDASYRTMWREIIANGQAGEKCAACTFAQGAEIVGVIADCERSAREPRWIER